MNFLLECQPTYLNAASHIFTILIDNVLHSIQVNCIIIYYILGIIHLFKFELDFLPAKMIGERKEKKFHFRLKTKFKEIFSKHHFMEGKVWLGQYHPAYKAGVLLHSCFWE
jgi:hypothetical protein